jgi:hypothetical protein
MRTQLQEKERSTIRSSTIDSRILLSMTLEASLHSVIRIQEMDGMSEGTHLTFSITRLTKEDY